MKKILYTWGCFALAWLMLSESLTAQSLDYWFDTLEPQSVGNVAIGNTDKEVSLTFNKLDKLSNGLHRLYMLYQGADGALSPMNSALFIKLPTTGAGNQSPKLRYCFDEPNATPTIIDYKGDGLLEVEMLKNKKLSNGLHTLYLQYQDDKGALSPMVSALFIRLPNNNKLLGQSLARITYWCDDINAKKSAVLQGKRGDSFDLNLMLPKDLTFGLHSLYLQYQDALGNYSPLTSALFIKTAQQTADNIVAFRYWFDNDRRTAKVHQLPTDLPSGSIYELQLSLRHIKKGKHWLHLAPITEAGIEGNTQSYEVEVLKGLTEDFKLQLLSPNPNDLVPKQVNKGTEVYYHYRILDSNDEPVQGVCLEVESSANKRRFSSLPSNEKGLACIAIETEGDKAALAKGEQTELSVVGAKTMQDEAIPFSKDYKVLPALKLGLNQADGYFTPIAKTELSLAAGVKAELNLKKAKASLGLNSALSFGLGYDDYGNLESLAINQALDIGGEAKSDIPVLNVGGSAGLGLERTEELSLDEKYRELAIIYGVLGILDSPVICTSVTMKAGANILRKYLKKKGYMQDILLKEEEAVSWHIGANGSLSINMPFSYKSKKSAFYLPQMNFGGAIEYKAILAKTVQDYDLNKNFYEDGQSLSLKLDASLGGNPNKTFITPLAKTLGFTGLYRGAKNTATKELFTKFINKVNFKYQTGYELGQAEVFEDKAQTQLYSLGSSYKKSAIFSLSLEALEREELKSLAEYGGLSAEIKFGLHKKHQLEAKGDFARYLYNNKDKQGFEGVKKLYPYLNNSAVKTVSGLLYYRKLWLNNSLEEQVRPIAQAYALSHKAGAKLKDDFVISVTDERTADAEIEFPIYKFELVDLKLNLAFGLSLEAYPSKSYYSVTEGQFLPVVQPKEPSVVDALEQIYKRIRKRIDDTFDDERKKELDEVEVEYERMKQLSCEKTVEGFKPLYTTLTNKGLAHEYIRSMKHYERLRAAGQEDVSTMTFVISNGEEHFQAGTKLKFGHFYPAGDLYAVTTKQDTLLVLSEVFMLRAEHQGKDVKKAPNGKFSLESHLGLDDLKPFGLGAKTTVALYYSPAGEDSWQAIGAVGEKLMVDKMGDYMIATSLKSDKEAPTIELSYDKEYARLSLKLSDNFALKAGKTLLAVNGVVRELKLRGVGEYTVDLEAEDVQADMTVFVSAEDIAGNKARVVKEFPYERGTGIEQLAEDKSLSCYPNPAKSYTTLVISDSLLGTRAELYDLMGAKVLNLRLDDRQTRLDVSELSNGLYFIRLANKRSLKLEIRR